jgi:SAM-dependent methyltransferase
MTERICVFCENVVDAWLPWRGGIANIAKMSPFVVKLGGVGSNVDRLFCPRCQCTDRERHLRLYLERTRVLEPLRGGAVLHMAPEVFLRPFIEGYGFSRYVSGDLSPYSPTIQRIDLCDLPFPNKSFDLVVCNHVLEHVFDLDRAFSELVRVLKPGGRAICQTPYVARLSHMFEDPRLQSEEDRVYFYGQEDHVRLFGADIAAIFNEAGLRGRLVPHEELLPDIDPERYGVNEIEPFFDFVRPQGVRAALTAARKLSLSRLKA